MKKLTSIILSILIVAGTFSCLSFTSASAATTSQYNIMARANYLWNIVWYSKKDVAGWKSQSTFAKGKGYHLPYGQPVESGEYIGYGVSVSDFVSATKDENSVFYTSKSLYNGSYSTYYAIDCSAFVSWCWGTVRHTTATIPNIARYIGKADMNYIPSLEIGDALNSSKMEHVVLVTGLTYCDGELATIQITEQTTPQMKRFHYTPEELATKYSTNYSIYRYEGEVPKAPSANLSEGTQPTDPVVEYFPACSSSQTSIIVALNEIGVDNSYSYRKEIAAANGISGYSGSDTQNMQLLNLLKQGLLINPDTDSSTENGAITDSNLPDFSPPLGALETINVKPNSLTFNGWAYDPDDFSALLDIHIYIGGDSTSEEAEHHILKADQLREDIDTAYTTGKYHGFSGSVNTNLTGSQVINVYAGNVGVGYDMHIGYVSVDIPEDTTAPEITDAEIAKMGSNSYTVSCKVSDDSGIVTSVKFASFLSTQTIEDATWYEGTVENGVATAVIPVSDDGTYITHIYAYDYKGNYSTAEISGEINLDAIAPEITKATITDITSDSYTVSCNVTDNKSISAVKFASFHSSKTIEDAYWCEGTVADGVATAQISILDLGFLSGTYYTHIYAYDKAGNFTIEKVSVDMEADTNGPAITDIRISDVSSHKFTVTCNISDDNTVTDIKIESYKLSETIESPKANDYTFKDGVATATIAIDGYGIYYLCITAYDKYGNCTVEEKTIVAEEDETPPLISDVKITDINNNGYSVSCNVADRSDISSVKFLSYHSSQSSDKGKWHTGTLKNGVATVTIPIKDFDNLSGIYYTTIYAYDIHGNVSVEIISANVIIDDTAPEITDIVVSDITNESYTVTCKVSDSSGISSVKFLAFHSSKTSDEGIWYEGTVKNGVATVTVPLKDLGNAGGTYYTYIHAYDSYENHSVHKVTTEVNSTPAPAPFTADVTGDGETDIQDVTAIQHYLADLATFEENQLKNADVNGDGKISVRDATTLQLYLAKKITL